MLLPGLNTQSDSTWSSSAEHVKSKQNRFLHEQVDFVDQKDVACASPRLSGLLEESEVDRKTDVQDDLDRGSMLQPLTKAAMKIPKRHEPTQAEEQELPAAATSEEKVEHIVTTVNLNDSIAAFAYSSVNEGATETDSLSRPIPLNESFSQEPELKPMNEPAAAEMNFSDTPANPFGLPLTDNRMMQAPTSAPAIGSNSGLIVHPPMLQPYNANQFTFVVENGTQGLARDVAIEISVSENAKIVAALPGNSVSSDSKAIFKFSEISAGDKLQLHLNAISKDGQPIEFAANVVTRSTYDFAVQETKDGGRLARVSHQLSDVGAQNVNAGQQVEQQPATGGPRLVHNPFFQDGNQIRYSGSQTNRH